MDSPNLLDLQEALDHNEILPYFQPLIELRSGRLTGFEVLARWVRPHGQFISPTEFIPLAETSGLIAKLTHSLLRSAFVAAATIPEHLTLSINISPFQLHDTSLTRQIVSAASSTGFSIDRLILEITETTLASNMDDACLIAHELKLLGARLSLDDFGTGYSSLRRLLALPFDEIKIDASFVRAMTGSTKSRRIVAAIIGLGQSLGLVTVGESIETKAQADMLLALGCEIGQGWLFGQAVPAVDIATIVAEREVISPHELSKKIQLPIM